MTGEYVREGKYTEAYEYGCDLETREVESDDQRDGRDQVVVQRPGAEVEVRGPLATADPVDVLPDDRDVAVHLARQHGQSHQAKE